MTAIDEPRPKKQMNVRIDPDLIEEIDSRRDRLSLSRDVWVERALRYALRAQPSPRTATRDTRKRR